MKNYLYSIRFQILLALLLASLLPLIVLSSYALNANSAILREHAIEQQKVGYH